MKTLDYASLFISMVSLVWMLTLVQEMPAANANATQEVPSTGAEMVALSTPTSLQPASDPSK